MKIKVNNSTYVFDDKVVKASKKIAYKLLKNARDFSKEYGREDLYFATLFALNVYTKDELKCYDSDKLKMILQKYSDQIDDDEEQKGDFE